MESIDVSKLKDGRRVDVHHHIVLPEYTKALEEAGIVERSARLYNVNSPTATCDVLAELGVDVAILSPYTSHGIHIGDDAKARHLTEVTNEAAARYVAQAPKQLGFFAILPLPDVGGALKQLEYALDTLHADGVAFLSNQNGRYIGDPAFEELYAEMNRRSVVAFIHPAYPPYGNTLQINLWPAILEFVFDTTRAAVSLIYNGIMARYPNIKWVLAHAGGTLPFLARRLGMLEDDLVHKPLFRERIPEGYKPYLRQFYYDTAISGSVAPMAALTEVTDASQLVYGSDWPYLSKEFTADQVDQFRKMTQFSGGRLAAMERDNAHALFRRFAPQRSAGLAR